MARREISVNARARAISRGAFLILALAAGTRPLAAQASTQFTEDAAPVPKGTLRFRVIPSWTRADERYLAGADSTVPLGAVRTSGALGPAQIPSLGPIESALRAITGNQAFALSLGAARTVASTRTVRVPLILEYGLTHRITLGVNVPFVKWRAQIDMRVDSTGSNVGVAPRSGAEQVSQIQAQLQSSVTALGAAIAACEKDPNAGPACTPINADMNGAKALLASLQDYHTAVGTLFGGDASFMVRSGSAAAQAITARATQLNQQYRQFLGSDAFSGTLPLATGPAGLADVRSYLLSASNSLGPDTIGTVQGLALGDIEVGARMVLLDHWLPRAPASPTDTVPIPALGWRLTGGALARLGTGTRPSGRQFLDPGTGDGQTDIEGSALLDLRIGRRFGANALARYTVQTGTVAAAGQIPDSTGTPSGLAVPAGTSQKLGNVMSLELSPRFFVNDAFSIDAHYGLDHKGDDTWTFPAPDSTLLANWVGSASGGGYTLHRAGFGFTYSTLRAFERGAVKWPIELAWTHLEVIRANSGMVPHEFREQISLRIYYQLFGRR